MVERARQKRRRVTSIDGVGDLRGNGIDDLVHIFHEGIEVSEDKVELFSSDGHHAWN